MEILNKSYEKNLVVERSSPIGFVIIETENLPHKHATKKVKKKKNKISKETPNKKTKKKRQYEGFLNRYDFAYAGRDN